MGTVRETGGAV